MADEQGGSPQIPPSHTTRTEAPAERRQRAVTGATAAMGAQQSWQIDALIALAQRGEPIEVVIDGYGYGGEGFVRVEDGWLSVPGALPGERVQILMSPPERLTRRLFARVLRVIEARPERGDPMCPQAGVCRGCQLRHMTVSEELRFKHEAVREVVEKFAGVPREAQPPVERISPDVIMRGDAERLRTNLSFRRTADGSFELGLRAPAHPHLIAMDTCPALTNPVQRAVRLVRRALDEALADRLLLPDADAPEGTALLGVRVAAPMHGHGFVVLEVRPAAGVDLEELMVRDERLDRLVGALDAALPAEFGIFVQGSGEPIHARGPELIRLPVLPDVRDGLLASPNDWFHATHRPASALYDALPGWLQLAPEDALLDIGCGIGTIALRSAPSVRRVLGLDHNRTSIARAQANAARLHLSARAEFVVGSWESALRRLCMAGDRFSVATINPMREPLGERALAYLQPLGIQRLVYLGPSMSSAARDLGTLRSQGWRLDRLGCAMLHPATYHAMLVARLVR